MSTDDCFSSLPDSTRTVRLSWIVGCILSGIGYGALLVIGYACYVGLRRRRRRRDSQNGPGGHSQVNKLTIYVVFILVLATVTEVIEIIRTVNGVLDDVCFFQNLRPPNPYLGPFAIPGWLINITTDGLFVWRCYTVCGGLRGQRGWFTLLWAMPLIVYIVMLCTGFTVVTRVVMFKASGGVSDVLAPFQYGITAFLNALITASIIIVMLCSRRLTREALGESHQLLYLNIMTLLIESASLVVVIDIFALAGYIQGNLGNIAAQVWIPMQPMASLLVIYRVSQGSDYFHRQSEEISSLRFEQVSELHVEHPV